MEFLKLHYKEDRFINEIGFNNDREERKTLEVIKELKEEGVSVITYQSSKTNNNIFFDCNLNIIDEYSGKKLNISNLF